MNSDEMSELSFRHPRVAGTGRMHAEDPNSREGERLNHSYYYDCLDIISPKFKSTRYEGDWAKYQKEVMTRSNSETRGRIYRTQKTISGLAIGHYTSLHSYKIFYSFWVVLLMVEGYEGLNISIAHNVAFCE